MYSLCAKIYVHIKYYSMTNRLYSAYKSFTLTSPQKPLVCTMASNMHHILGEINNLILENVSHVF